MGGRRTNLALLLLLAAAFLTGWLAFSFNAFGSMLALVVHGVAGLAILGLLPWKSMLARRSLVRRGHSLAAAAAVLLGLLVLVSIGFGVLHSAGGPFLWAVPLLDRVPVVRDLTAMDFHVGAALALIPLALWHLQARPVRLRPTDLSRRVFLRFGLLLGAAGAAFAVLPSASRAPTGSYRLVELPATSWMFDAVPPAGPGAGWSLRAGRRRWTYAELAGFGDRVSAVIDCTGGWYSEQEWEGAWLTRLLPPAELAGAASVVVVSQTGYWRRFAVADLGGLLLATRVAGADLAPGNGHPVRLVAPGRRGFWWVKWVAELRPDPLPWWWQPPYPTQ
jgi:Oxidoreductase molybdopterin binding domain